MSLKNCQNIYSRTPHFRPLWDRVKAGSQKSQIIRFAQENPFNNSTVLLLVEKQECKTNRD